MKISTDDASGVILAPWQYVKELPLSTFHAETGCRRCTSETDYSELYQRETTYRENELKIEKIQKKPNFLWLKPPHKSKPPPSQTWIVKSIFQADKI